MSEPSRLRPLKEAARITQMLDIVLGADRFDRAPVDVVRLALEYSRKIAPDSPIHEVVARNIPGCVGALVYGEARPRQWAIMYQVGQSDGRRSFTVGHEFAHYLLHRQLIEQDGNFDGGIYCDENAVDRRGGSGIEQEADEFAVALLMPLHDFRRQQLAKARADFDTLSRLAKRYGVSLTAAILRWLEYTETRGDHGRLERGFRPLGEAEWSCSEVGTIHQDEEHSLRVALTGFRRKARLLRRCADRHHATSWCLVSRAGARDVLSL